MNKLDVAAGQRVVVEHRSLISGGTTLATLPNHEGQGSHGQAQLCEPGDRVLDISWVSNLDDQAWHVIEFTQRAEDGGPGNRTFTDRPRPIRKCICVLNGQSRCPRYLGLAHDGPRPIS